MHSFWENGSIKFMKEGNGICHEKRNFNRKLRHNRTRMLTTAKWIGVSVITGCVVGLIASIFALLLNLVTELRILHPQLLLLLRLGPSSSSPSTADC